MDDLGGTWSQPLSLQEAGEAVNASLTGAAGGPGFTLPTQIQLVLEILMVLMCLGAVAGT